MEKVLSYDVLCLKLQGGTFRDGFLLRLPLAPLFVATSHMGNSEYFLVYHFCFLNKFL